MRPRRSTRAGALHRQGRPRACLVRPRRGLGRVRGGGGRAARGDAPATRRRVARRALRRRAGVQPVAAAALRQAGAFADSRDRLSGFPARPRADRRLCREVGSAGRPIQGHAAHLRPAARATSRCAAGCGEIALGRLGALRACRLCAGSTVRVDAAGEPWLIDVNANPCLAADAGFMAAAGRGLSRATRRARAASSRRRRRR